MRVVMALLALGGCAAEGARTELTSRPPDGYEALRVVQTFRVEGPVGNTLEFPAGAIFVSDRKRVTDGAALWCGPMTIIDIAAEYRLTCFRREGQRMFLVADRLERGYPRDIPPGAMIDVRQ